MISAVTNTGTLSAQQGFNRNLLELANVLQRLSTGRRINAGKDDPAGLIASEQLASEIEALEAASASLSRADANANIADGNIGQLLGLMGELNGLVVQGANTAGMSDAERDAIQLQIDSTVDSIQRITGEAVSSLYGFNLPDNGNAEVAALLNGASAGALSVASGGANSLASGNYEAAQSAIESALLDVATARGEIGAFQKNTLEPLYNAKQIAIENLSESKSRIVDTDYAVETSKLARSQILTQASVNILKIAQDQAKQVLNLLA
jgi:flagellin